MVQNRSDWQKVGRKHLVPAGHQCVSFSLLQSRALTTREYSERQTRLGDTPDPNSSWRLSSPSRDHRPPPSRDTRRSRVLSILHANPRRWLPNGHPEPNRFLPRRIQRQRPGHLRYEHLLTRSELHFPWWTRVESRFARGHDRPAVRERLVVVSGRKRVPVVQREEW